MAEFRTDREVHLKVVSETPAEEVYEALLEAVEQYNKEIGGAFSVAGIEHSIEIPERNFLIEIGSVNIVLYLAAAGGGGMGIYLVKKAIDSLVDIGTFARKEQIRAQTERAIAQSKSEFDLKTAKEKAELEAEQASPQAQTSIALDANQMIAQRLVHGYLVQSLRERGIDAK
jgi:hypothetical protein